MTLGALVLAHSNLNHRVRIPSFRFCLLTDALGTAELTVEDKSRVGRLPVSVTVDDVAA